MPEQDINTTSALETPKDMGKGPRGVVAYWKKELELATKREKEWRKRAKDTYERYRYANKKEGEKAHNILWANTEIMRPLLYSQTPTPDVRRRFRDKDPLGKEISEIVERALSYSVDAYDFDSTMDKAVSDYLLGGRAVDRVRYVPYFRGEELIYEEVTCEHVTWNDFRHGHGEKWDDVTWVAFRHFLKRKQIKEQFPDFKDAATIELNSSLLKPEEDKDEYEDNFKRLEVWEIWDKEARKILYIAPSYEYGPLEVSDDTMTLERFFPIPEPLLSINSPDTLEPIPEYYLYKDQADELDDITKRIAGIVRSLKVRGVFDATMSELARVMEAGDNELVPAQNVVALVENGGIDRGIWMMPIETSAAVLNQLMLQREAIKNEIYEITGLSDIMRGVSDPGETLGAQQLKTNWGGTRMEKRKMDLHSYVRDLFKIKAEIICEKFNPRTIMLMTGKELTEAHLAIMRNDTTRAYKIDIETDSTVSSRLQTDQRDMTELLTGIAGYFDSIGPAVQAGYLPVDTAKTILMSAIRRMKMGREVEDALDQIGGDQEGQQVPQIDPQQIEMMVQQRAEQLAMESEKVIKAQNDQAKVQNDMQMSQAKMSQSIQEAQAKLALDRDKMLADIQLAREKMRADFQVAMEKMQAEMMLKQQQGQESKDKDICMLAEAINNLAESMNEEEEKTPGMDSVMMGLQMALERLSAPKRIITDETGMPVGVEPVG